MHEYREPEPALILGRADVAALLSRRDYLDAVEAGFRALGEGTSTLPAPLHLPGLDGGFHAKGATFKGARPYAALKLNGNFPENRERTGLPTIQGVILLMDAGDGSLLAILDSIEVTLRRTAAATALAARYLARPESAAITVCGCGDQGRAQLEALADVLPLGRAWAWDRDAAKAAAFAHQLAGELGIEITAVGDLAPACHQSDLIVTCTSARAAFLSPDMVRPGTFIAAVGADNPLKSEIMPALMQGATVFVDVLAQCREMGDLHHALAAGCMPPGWAPVEMSELVVGRKPGRADDREITLFDSTGTAVQDAASAAWAYERATARGLGGRISLR